MANRAFYNTLKSEITKGQFLLNQMNAKIDIALAKDYLTFDEAGELKTLAITSQDPTYKPLVTLEDRLATAEVEVLNNKLCVAELSGMLFDVDDALFELQEKVNTLHPQGGIQ